MNVQVLEPKGGVPIIERGVLNRGVLIREVS